ncbi:MAG: translation initiation factor [Ginsengibacter sp.]
MNRKKSKSSGGIVYSTSQDFKLTEEEEQERIIAPPAQQQLKVLLDRKQRGGKVVTLIEGLQLSDSDIDDMARQLKTHCGGGGSAKNGEIIIQGDHRDKIVQWLIKKGFSKTKRVS